ncbi:cellulose binding domain-containing protein [Saccharophagus sp. K07]|uniref:cellulose binding domain-containing protein n=1 Tax=Saccharophagus sp. K07 TaxID=2283636 RepID=UPI00351BF472
MNWTYSDRSTIDSSWNGNILPGQTVSFGMQGNKGSGESVELPQLQGELCTR